MEKVTSLDKQNWKKGQRERKTSTERERGSENTKRNGQI